MSAPPHPVTLRNGRRLVLRAVAPSDREALQRFENGLSRESRYLRYFTARKQLPERELAHFLTPDSRNQLGLVACDGDAIVGHALCERSRSDPTCAEVALEVADALQGQGLGTLLLEALAPLARAAGLLRFSAHVLPVNQRMLAVFRDLGFEEHARFEDGVVLVELALTPSARFEVAQRQRAAAGAT